jgi:hypothetical protein
MKNKDNMYYSKIKVIVLNTAALLLKELLPGPMSKNH